MQVVDLEMPKTQLTKTRPPFNRASSKYSATSRKYLQLYSWLFRNNPLPAYELNEFPIVVYDTLDRGTLSIES